MILKDFLNHANKVKKLVDKHNNLFTYLEKISSHFKDYISLCKLMRNSYSNNGNTTQQNMSNVVNQINSLDKTVLSIINKYEPYDLFTEIQSLISSFEEIDIFQTVAQQPIELDIKTLINLQTQAFSVKKFDEIFSFVSFCDQFLHKLEKYKYTAEIFLSNLDLSESELPENNQLIDIQVISALNNLEEFSSFLLFIDNLYQGLSKAFVIHYNDFPLKIVKVESGSIWSKLFGHEKLIELIKDLLFGLGKYIRDLQTGQIDREKFENKIKKAGLVLDLVDKAKSVGLDEKNQVLIEKIFNQSITDIAKLLPKTTTEIMVDNKKLLNLDETETKAIEGKKPLMLNDKNEENTSA
nr:hypothetical protein [uncultured Draconibacterium sp.]